jgi:hypothetical protein
MLHPVFISFHHNGTGFCGKGFALCIFNLVGKACLRRFVGAEFALTASNIFFASGSFCAGFLPPVHLQPSGW